MDINKSVKLKQVCYTNFKTGISVIFIMVEKLEKEKT